MCRRFQALLGPQALHEVDALEVLPGEPHVVRRGNQEAHHAAKLKALEEQMTGINKKVDQQGADAKLLQAQVDSLQDTSVRSLSIL